MLVPPLWIARISRTVALPGGVRTTGKLPAAASENGVFLSRIPLENDAALRCSLPALSLVFRADYFGWAFEFGTATGMPDLAEQRLRCGPAAGSHAIEHGLDTILSRRQRRSRARGQILGRSR